MAGHWRADTRRFSLRSPRTCANGSLLRDLQKTPHRLLGIPAFPLLGNPFKRQVTVVIGYVVATDRTRVLTSGKGARETLRDAILFAVPGVVQGESGGKAVDLAGNVVGVIEGSAPEIATLTPVSDLTSPH